METRTMKRAPALFLQGVVVLIGLAVFAFLLWEPHVEGRNAQATVFEIYFKDPFLAYVYVGSIPFFLGLRRAFGLLEDVRREGAFSLGTVKALRSIKRCALIVVAFVVGAAGLILMMGEGEDHAGGIFMCFLAIVASGSVATAAAVLARKLQLALGGGA